MSMSKEGLLEMLRELFSPGKVVLITGGMGSGKTSAALYFAVLMMRHFNYYVLSNIVIKERLPDAEDGSKRWKRATYPHYVLIKSFSELYYNMARIRTSDPKARFLWLLDEAIVSGISSRHSVFTEKQRGMVMFLTLLRKMGLSVIFISLAGSLLPTHIREVGGAFVSGLISKEKKMIRKRAWHLLKKYDERAISILTMPQYGSGYEILTMNNVRDMELVKPEQYAEVGDVVFDTFSPASFDMGVTGPGSRKPFIMEHFLSFISDKLSHEISPAMLEYFEREGDVEVGFDVSLTLEEALKPAVKGTERWRKEIALPVMRDELPNILKRWKKKRPPSKAWLARELQKVLKEHDIELSLSSIKTSYIPPLLEELEKD